MSRQQITQYQANAVAKGAGLVLTGLLSEIICNKMPAPQLCSSFQKTMEEQQKDFMVALAQAVIVSV